MSKGRVINRTVVLASRGKFPDFCFLFRVSRNFFNTDRQKCSRILSRIAEKSSIVAELRLGALCEPCAPCHYPALYRIDQGHTQGHSQAVACRRKRRAQRELYLSSRHSRLTDLAEIDTKSPAIFMSWRALSRQKLSSRGTARHGRLSRSRGTFSGTNDPADGLRARRCF